MSYAITFFITALLTYWVQRLFNQNKKKAGIILSIIIILIPSIFAGVRDTTIGTDVNQYVGSDFYYALKTDSIQEYFEISKEEPLYTLLNYIISRFTTDVHWLLFAVQLIMTSLVYVAIYKQKEKIPMWISMLVYLILIYTRFLNLIRQGIAVCIIIFAFSYIENKKIIKYLLLIIIATLFHRTAILALPLYFIYWLVNQKDDRSKKTLLLMYVLLIASVFCYDFILELLLKWKILPTKFEMYLGQYKRKELDVNIFLTLYKAIWIFIIAIFYRQIEKKDNNTKVLFNLLLIDIILIQFSIKIENAERLSYYYGCIAHLFLIPQIPNAITVDALQRLHINLPIRLQQNKILQTIAKMGIIILLVFYFYWCFIHYSSGEIYPYTSKILGI